MKVPGETEAAWWLDSLHKRLHLGHTRGRYWPDSTHKSSSGHHIPDGTDNSTRGACTRVGRRNGSDGSDLQTLEGQPGTREIIQIMCDAKDQNQNPIVRVQVRQEEGLCNGPGCLSLLSCRCGRRRFSRKSDSYHLNFSHESF